MIRGVLGSRASIGGPLGSGRGGAAGLPVSGALLWLDASQITGLSDGSAISTWPDMSGNGYNAAQTTGSVQPTYKTNILNGKPVARFDGGDRIETASDLVVDSQTIFVVWVPASTITVATAAAFLLNSNSADAGIVSLGSTTGAVSNERLIWYNVTGALYSYAQNTSDISGAQILTLRWNESTLTATMLLNGANAINTSTNGGFSAAKNPVAYRYIGASATMTAKYTGDIAEIIIYNSALSDANRQAVEAYLAAKYGITVS